MNAKHYKILEFLDLQEEPVRIKDFPNQITADFPIKGIKKGTLIYELEIVLNNMEWVLHDSYANKYYSISTHGKEALKRENIRLQQFENSKVNNSSVYNILQAGAVGPNSKASNNVFNQINYSLPSDTNFELLSSELFTLRQALLSKASSPEDYIAIGEVANAQIASKNKDGHKVITSLLSAGKWVLDAAKDIGTDLVAEIVKKHMMM